MQLLELAKDLTFVVGNLWLKDRNYRNLGTKYQINGLFFFKYSFFLWQSNRHPWPWQETHWVTGSLTPSSLASTLMTRFSECLQRSLMMWTSESLVASVHSWTRIASRWFLISFRHFLDFYSQRWRVSRVFCPLLTDEARRHGAREVFSFEREKETLKT